MSITHEHRREKLKTLGYAAKRLYESGLSVRALARQLEINPTYAHRALASIGVIAPRTTCTGRKVTTWAESRAKLLEDGHEALRLLAKGWRPRELAIVIDGSRARLYRAMDLAQAEVDELLL